MRYLAYKSGDKLNDDGWLFILLCPAMWASALAEHWNMSSNFTTLVCHAMWGKMTYPRKHDTTAAFQITWFTFYFYYCSYLYKVQTVECSKHTIGALWLLCHNTVTCILTFLLVHVSQAVSYLKNRVGRLPVDGWVIQLTFPRLTDAHSYLHHLRYIKVTSPTYVTLSE